MSTVGGYREREYFAALKKSNDGIWSAMIDSVIVESPAWATICFVLQDMKECAAQGHNVFFLGSAATPEVVMWFRQKGFTVEGAHVRIN